MNIDIALLQIAILFFPGIILTTILQLLKKRGESYSALQLTLYSFVFGMLVNLIIYITIFHKEIPILILLMKLDILHCWIILCNHLRNLLIN